MEISGGIQASLSGRYALALFELARDGKEIDSVADSLARVKAAIEQSDAFAKLIRSPLVGRKDAGEAVAGVAGSLEIDPLTARFLGVLAANRRLAELPRIIATFAALAAEHRGQVAATVTSAHPLTDDQVAALKAKLKAELHADVAIDLTVDPAILGGLIVKVGSRQVDGSIRTKLNSLAHAMKG